MTLEEKHITYENECRQMFVGQKIRDVIYGELKYFQDEHGNNINPEPLYETKYSEIDTLDHSIYFKTDNKTIYIYWDSTFFNFGLKSDLIDFTEKTNNFEQKWNVSNDIKWKEIIGQLIIDFKIIWEKVYTLKLDGTNDYYTIYPQTFEFKTENDNIIILSAAELKDDNQNIAYHMSDNLLVTTNIDMALKLRIIE